MTSFRGNLGNLLQHWTWVELLTYLGTPHVVAGATLSLIDAHSMAPSATPSIAHDADFSHAIEAVRHSRALESRYLMAWRNLTATEPTNYPSTAAFTEQLWDGPLNFLLCESNPETVASIQSWLDTDPGGGHIQHRDVAFGDWRTRFGHGLIEAGDLSLLSFDPYMFNRHGPTPKRGNMWPDDLDIVINSISNFLGPTLIQLSTYTANNNNSQGKVRPIWDARFAASGFDVLASIRPNGNMMTAVFGRNLSSGCAKVIREGLHERHFRNWRQSLANTGH